MKKVLNKVLVLRSFVSTGKYQQVLKNIVLLSKNKRSSYVCVSNVHMLVEAYGSELFEIVVNSADIVTPDGMPLAKAIKMLYGLEQERVAGMDLMPDLMKVSEKQNLSIFLYGSTDEVLEKMIEKAKYQFPDLKINAYSPPFNALTEDEKEEIIKKINLLNPDFVFVALGCPKQEKW